MCRSPATSPSPVAHAPALQRQLRPHAPQWALLVRVSTQAPPQSVVPVAHAQTPATHDCPVAQAFPHAPQFDALVFVSTQAPPQTDCPEAQHIPCTHDCPAPQEIPHALQCEALVRTLVSQPVESIPSQSPKPAAQAFPHAPLAHTGEALALVGQAFPHAPQFETLVFVSTQTPPHAVCPAGQQTPEEQVCPVAQQLDPQVTPTAH